MLSKGVDFGFPSQGLRLKQFGYGHGGNASQMVCISLTNEVSNRTWHIYGILVSHLAYGGYMVGIFCSLCNEAQTEVSTFIGATALGIRNLISASATQLNNCASKVTALDTQPTRHRVARNKRLSLGVLQPLTKHQLITLFQLSVTQRL